MRWVVFYGDIDEHTSVVEYSYGNTTARMALPASRYSTLKVSRPGSLVGLYSFSMSHTVYAEDARKRSLKVVFQAELVKVQKMSGD